VSYCALHNETVETPRQRTPVALFVALTRAVHEAPVSTGARDRAYDIIERMAHAVYKPTFAVEVEALASCATYEPRFFGALQPFWKELRVLSGSSSMRASSTQRDW
jgi:hypothetical protein